MLGADLPVTWPGPEVESAARMCACVCVYTMTPLVYFALYECHYCALWAALVGSGSRRLSFFLSSSDNGAILTHITVCCSCGGKVGDGSVAAGQSGPMFRSESAAKSRPEWRRVECDGRRRGDRGGKVVSELAVCQRSGRLESRADALELGAGGGKKKRRGGEGRGGRRGRSRGRQQWPDGAQFVLKWQDGRRRCITHTPAAAAAAQQTAISSTAGQGRRVQLKVRRIQPSRLDIQGPAVVVGVVGGGPVPLSRI